MINPLEFSEREEVVNMSFIEIKGLSKIFLQGNQKIYGIRNVNISIERGTFMSVIGRSGSGKSVKRGCHCCSKGHQSVYQAGGYP